jgi:hypothetical protein
MQFACFVRRHPGVYSRTSQFGTPPARFSKAQILLGCARMKREVIDYWPYISRVSQKTGGSCASVSVLCARVSMCLAVASIRRCQCLWNVCAVCVLCLLLPSCYYPRHAFHFLRHTISDYARCSSRLSFGFCCSFSYAYEEEKERALFCSALTVFSVVSLLSFSSPSFAQRRTGW